MTLDEAIKEFTEWAKNDRDEMNYWLGQINECDEESPLSYADCGGFARDKEASAERYEQLIEWLKELKEAKRLLKAAMEDIVWLNEHTVDGEGRCLIETATDMETCLACPLNVNNSHICGWKHQVDALKLIGETNDEP